MPVLETISEADLRGLFNSKSLRRARGYIDRVRNPIRTGQTLTAQVPGTRLYYVKVEAKEKGIQAICSCPYDWGGYCKHIGAVLFKWIESPGSFAVKEALPVSDEFPIEVVQTETPSTYRPERLPDWITISFQERRAVVRAQLEEWLTQVKMQDLRQMGENRGWQLKGTRKANVARQVSEYITDTDDIRRAVEGLDREHRQMQRALFLLSAGPKVWPDDLERVGKRWGAFKTYPRASTYTRHLWEVGLALPGYARERSDTLDFIPWAMARHFPPLLDDLATEPPVDSEADHVRLADPYALVRAVNQVMLLLEQAPVRLRPPMPRPRLERFYSQLEGWEYDPQELAEIMQGGMLNRPSHLTLTVPPPRRFLPDEAIERLAPLAGGERQLEFIYSLLVAVGVFQPGSPTTVWPEVENRFLQLHDLDRRAVLARAYFQMRNWSAVWEALRTEKKLRLRRVWRYAHYTPENLRADLVRFRHLVLRALAALPDGQWIALHDFLDIMRTIWPCFDQTVWHAYHYPSSRPQGYPTGAWFLAWGKEDPADWDVAQGSFVRHILMGPLHWLGLADLRFDGDNLVGFCLHGLADLYMDRVESVPAPQHITDQTQAESPADAVTTDHLSISVHPSAVSTQVHSLLDKIARLDKVRADLFVYRLDPQAAYEAFEAGTVLSEVLADWEQLLSIPVPDSICAQLTEWWDAYGRVRIYKDLTVIEFSDDYALAEMKAVTSLEDHLITEVSPRLVIIRQEALQPLTAELEKAGYTPKNTEEV